MGACPDCGAEGGCGFAAVLHPLDRAAQDIGETDLATLDIVIIESSLQPPGKALLLRVCDARSLGFL